MRILKNVFTDIPMFFSKNTFTGDLNIRRDSLSIKDSIKNIVLTLFRERPFDPEFGTNVLTGLFENPSDFSFYVENTIGIALERYEPRIKLTNITSTFENRALTIKIEFNIKNYEVYDQMSFTMDSTRYMKIPQVPTTRTQMWGASFVATDRHVAAGTIAPELLEDVNTFEFVKPIIHILDCTGDGNYSLTTPSQFINGELGCTDRFPSTISKLMEIPDGKRMYNMWRYTSGPIYREVGDRFLNGQQSPWAEKAGLTLINDWTPIATALKNGGAKPNYITIDCEQERVPPGSGFPYGASSDWTARVFGITSDVRFNQTWNGSKSFSSLITDDGDFAFSFSDLVSGTYQPQDKRSYQYWNRAVSSLHHALLNTFLSIPSKQIFKNVSVSQYGSMIATPDNWPENEIYDQNGHPFLYDNIVGDACSPELYAGWQYPGSYGIKLDDPTRLIRIDTATPLSPIPFEDNAWNQILVLIQKLRAARRNTPNLRIRPWVGSKDFVDRGNGFVGYWRKNSVNNSLYSEMIRHFCLTGVEAILCYNYFDTTTAQVQDTLTTLDNILRDVNSRLGGFIPSTADASRISFLTNILISGAPTTDGKFLWRVTPKPGIVVKDAAGSILVTDEDGGAWIVTNTNEKPVFTESDLGVVIQQRRGTDLVRRYYQMIGLAGTNTSVYDGWNEVGTILTFKGRPDTPTEVGAGGSKGRVSRAYPFEFSPANPATSSPWHNILYENYSESFFAGMRALQVNFPFGDAFTNHTWLLHPLDQLRGCSGYTFIYQRAGLCGMTNGYKSTTLHEWCPARVVGFTGAIRQLLEGTMAPSAAGRLPLNDHSDVMIYGPGCNGWQSYRNFMHDWWTRSGNTNAQRDSALIKRLDEMVDFYASCKTDLPNKGILSVAIDSDALSATPTTVQLYRTLKDYKSDVCELADWYFRNRLTERGIPCFVEARPPKKINQAITTGLPYLAGNVTEAFPSGITTGTIGSVANTGYAASHSFFTSDENNVWSTDPIRAANDGEHAYDDFVKNEDNSWTHRLNGSFLAKGARLPWGMSSGVTFTSNSIKFNLDLFLTGISGGYFSNFYTPHLAMSYYYAGADVYNDFKFRSTNDSRWANRRKFQQYSTLSLDPYAICGFYVLQPGLTVFGSLSGGVTGTYRWWKAQDVNFMPLFNPSGFTLSAGNKDVNGFPRITYTGGYWTSVAQGFSGSAAWYNANMRGTTFGQQLAIFKDLAENFNPPGTQNPPGNTSTLTSWGKDTYYNNTIDINLR